MLEVWQTATNPMHLAGVAGLSLFFAAVFMADMRRHRIAMLAGALLLVLQFALLTPQVTILSLATAFAIVNAIHLINILRRSRKGIQLTEEQELFEQVIRVEEPGQQRRMRDLLTWRDVEPGAVLMREGDPEPPLIYVASGEALIESNGKPVGNCSAGDFLGEMSIVSGQCASATVTASEAIRCARFDRDALAQVVRDIPELGKAIDSALNRSLAAKVLRMNRAVSDQASE